MQSLIRAIGEATYHSDFQSILTPMDSNLLSLRQLLAKVRSDFEITQERKSFGIYTIDLYRPTNPESVLDEETLLSSHGQLDWQPYSAQAWDASLGMCQYISTQQFAQKTVLDLGCGIGLTSAVLLAAGAIVTCGDNAPPSLLFAQINTWPWRDRATVQWIDWHNTRLDQRFDVIIGSDIVYERTEVRPLDQFFGRHLKPDGRVILSDPNRPMTREFLTMFRNLGWHLNETTVVTDGVEKPNRIIELEKG